MTSKTKIIVGVAILIILVGGLSYSVVNDYMSNSYSVSSLNSLYPESKTMIDKIETWQNKVKEEPGNTGAYATLGLAWKSLADKVAKDPGLYGEARKVYETAMQIVGPNNSLFILNAGDMAMFEKKYDIAEQYYKTAILNTPGEDQSYLALGRLLKLMGKSTDEILDVYKKGIETIVPPTQIILEKADYLAGIGKTEEAIVDYMKVYELTKSESILKEIEILKKVAESAK